MNSLRPGTRYLAAAAALLASSAAALAAIGAHLLARRLSPAALTSFDTAVAFQFVNAVGLFAFAWAGERLAASWLARACGWLLAAGILMFSGSIYLASFGLTQEAGPLAPAGGSSIILAWAGLAVAMLRQRG